ncbi:MAG: protease modulator HflC [Proteobacteria bacterium]|nr:protease modulator HflC [Pseudomonadota bacterium]
MNPVKIVALLVVALGGIAASQSLFVVDETEKALVLSLGKIDRQIAEPGLYVRVPFYQQVLKLERRILESDSEAEEIVARDKKRLVVDSFTRWRIADAAEFYQSVGSYARALTRLESIVNSVNKEVLAQSNLQDIISGDREALMANILKRVREQTAKLGIDVVDVRIKRTDLPKANSDAVFRRMRAERDKEAREIRAQGTEESDKIRADADRQVTILLATARKKGEQMRGEGDALAIKAYADAYQKDPAFYGFTRSLEAYRNSLKNPDTLLVLDPNVDFLQHFNKVKAE